MKKVVWCDVDILRHYRCFVEAPEDASRDDIVSMAYDKILTEQEDAIELDSNMIDHADIDSVFVDIEDAFDM